MIKSDNMIFIPKLYKSFGKGDQEDKLVHHLYKQNNSPRPKNCNCDQFGVTKSQI